MHSHSDNMSVDGGFDTLDYGYEKAPSGSCASRVDGERELWCAVIVQAFVDMGAIAPLTSGRRPEKNQTSGREFDEATRWLLRDKKDFASICELAGLSPHIIRKAAQIFYCKTQTTLVP